MLIGPQMLSWTYLWSLMCVTEWCMCVLLKLAACLWGVLFMDGILPCIATAQQPVAHHQSALGW